MSGTVEATLVVPRAPNFVRVEVKGVVGNGKLEQQTQVRVADLTDDQKDWLAAEWRKALDEVAKRQGQEKVPVYRTSYVDDVE